MIEVISLTTVTAVQRQRHLGRDVFIHGPANAAGFYIPGNATMAVDFMEPRALDEIVKDLRIKTIDRVIFIPASDWHCIFQEPKAV